MNTIPPKKEFIWGDNPYWARANKKLGAISFTSGLTATTLGISKSFIEKDSVSYRVVNFLESLFLGFRSNLQYSIYSRKEDDDLGEDLDKRPYAANIGEIACFTEKILNPILLLLSNFPGKEFREGYHSIAHLGNALWWRGRLFSRKINIKEILDSCTIEFPYIFSKNPNKMTSLQTFTSKISPFLGLLGFSFCGLFTPIKSFNRFMGHENKIINFLSDLGTTTQHIIYLFKFSLSELFNYQSTKKFGNKLLATLGLTANTLNIFMPFVNVFNFQSNSLDKMQKIYNELASGSSMTFFSTRRYLMGRDWLEKNRT